MHESIVGRSSTRQYAFQGSGVVVDVLPNYRIENARKFRIELTSVPEGITAHVSQRSVYILLQHETLGEHSIGYDIVDETGARQPALILLEVIRTTTASKLGSKVVAVAAIVTKDHRYVIWDEQRDGVRSIYQQSIRHDGEPADDRFTIVKASRWLGQSVLLAGAYRANHVVCWEDLLENGDTGVFAAVFDWPVLGKPFLASFADLVRYPAIRGVTVAALASGPTISWHRHPARLCAHAFAWATDAPPDGPLQTLTLSLSAAQCRSTAVSGDAYLHCRLHQTEIRAQLYHRSGREIWPEARQLVGGERIIDFDVVALPAGGFAIAWTTDPVNSDSEPGLFFQRFAPGGYPDGQPLCAVRNWSGHFIRLIGLQSGSHRIFWREWWGSRGAGLLSTSVTSWDAVGPVQVEVWAKDSGLSPAYFDALPMDGSAYSIAWRTVSGELYVQRRADPTSDQS